jgi:hypothetical protein
MITSLRNRLLLVIAGGSLLGACGSSTGSSNDQTTCVSRSEAWKAEAESEIPSTKVPSPLPTTCPTPPRALDHFLSHIGANRDGATLVGGPSQQGDQCCYTTTIIFDGGRPLLVEGRPRLAGLQRQGRWAT